MKNAIMKLLFNKTKWEPLAIYQYGYKEFIVFTRKNKNNGILEFKVKTFTPYARDSDRTFSGNQGINLNIQKQFDSIINK